jgi:hypothetical protein
MRAWQWLVVGFIFLVLYSISTAEITQIRDRIALEEADRQMQRAYSSIRVCRWASLALALLSVVAYLSSQPFVPSVWMVAAAWSVTYAIWRYGPSQAPIGAIVGGLILGIPATLGGGMEPAMRIVPVGLLGGSLVGAFVAKWRSGPRPLLGALGGAVICAALMRVLHGPRVAPLVLAAVFGLFLGWAISSGEDTRSGMGGWVLGWLFSAVYFGCLNWFPSSVSVTVGAGLVTGLVLALWFRARGGERGWRGVVSGVSIAARIGAIITAVLLIASRMTNGSYGRTSEQLVNDFRLERLAISLGMALVIAAVSGLVMWLIAIMDRRPHWTFEPGETGEM